MEKKIIEQLKKDLRIAVEKKDFAKMQEICRILNLDYS